MGEHVLTERNVKRNQYSLGQFKWGKGIEENNTK